MNETHGRPDMEQIADRIITLYGTISRWGARDFKRRQAPAGLTPTQFAILALIERFESLNTSQLADHLDLTVPTVVRAIDALERKGLVERRRRADDHREIALRVTPEGNTVRQEMEQLRRQRIIKLLSSMTAEEISGLLLGYEGMARAATQTSRQDKAV
jgi:MarR family transcriptional regulator for hemolysin